MRESSPLPSHCSTSRGKILVTPRSFTGGELPRLHQLATDGFELIMPAPGRHPTHDELLAAVPECVGYIAGVEKIDREVLRAGRNLKVISRNGVGVDNVDVEAARQFGITVLRATGANSRSVAELAWGLILALARSIPASHCALKAGRWERETGVELAGRRLGVLGCGQIGRIVVQFGLAFGMKVSAFDPFEDAGFRPGADFRYAPLDDVIAGSDFLSLHCPPSENGPLLCRNRLGSMRKGAHIVNCARADLIDEAALLGHLDDGHLSGYATDVFQTEPPGLDPLVQHPRVVASPHIGGFTCESMERVVATTVDQLLEALDASER